MNVNMKGQKSLFQNKLHDQHDSLLWWFCLIFTFVLPPPKGMLETVAYKKSKSIHGIDMF